jgi:hypothetical protein
VSEIYSKFSLDYDSFIALVYDLSGCINFRQSQPYESSTLNLTHQGEMAAEAYRKELHRTAFHITVEILTLVIAVAAFIQGFFVLPYQVAP